MLQTNTNTFLKPVTLATNLVELVPMTLAHLNAYCLAGNYPQVWQHMPINRCQNHDIAKSWMEEAINEMQQGRQLAFITIDKKTRYGYWLDALISLAMHTIKQSNLAIPLSRPVFKRSYVNSHAKFLMLEHAFEDLNMVRVEICTHENNQKSRNAITRIGGHFEGILRKHRRAPNGDYRSTAMFSIIDEQWPEVKQALLSTGKSQQEFRHVST